MPNETSAAGAADGPAAVVRAVFERIFLGDRRVFDAHPGLTALRAAFPPMIAAFPDFTAELQQQLVDGDRVASHWIFRGTHLGVLHGIAPTETPVRFQNISICRVEDGRIVQYNSAVDWLTVLKQVGALPLGER